MKVLVCHWVGGAFGYITESWIRAFHSAGIEATRWDGTRESWDRFQPDLYLGCSGHRQPIPYPRGNTKVAIHVNPFGSNSIIGIDESQPAIAWTVGQKPDAVFGYGFDHHANYWSRWTSNHRIPWVPMPTAGDVIQFKLPTTPTPRSVAIGYVGGRWGYKAQNIDKYLLPLFATAVKPVIHGWGDWEQGQCRGKIEEGDVCGFFQSCRAAPCISEPHTTHHGIDLPERVFKVALSGALPIHDPVVGLAKVLPYLTIAQDQSDFTSACLYAASLSETEVAQRNKLIRSEILANHTYHHRLRRLMLAMGLMDSALKLELALARLVKEQLA